MIMNYSELKLEELKRLLIIIIDKQQKADSKFIYWTYQNKIELIKEAIKEKESAK